MANRKRNLIILLCTAVVALLVAVALVVVPIFTHTSGGASGQDAPEGFVTQVEATGDDGRTRSLRVTAPDGTEPDVSVLSTGSVLVVEGSGYDTSNGIYVGFCRVPETPTERPSPCLGGIPEDAQEEKSANEDQQPVESAWVTNNWAWKSFASHQYIDTDAGTFSVELVVPPATSEGLDCTVQSCGIFTRADHTALNDRVQDLYLPFEITQ